MKYIEETLHYIYIIVNVQNNISAVIIPFSKDYTIQFVFLKTISSDLRNIWLIILAHNITIDIYKKTSPWHTCFTVKSIVLVIFVMTYPFVLCYTNGNHESKQMERKGCFRKSLMRKTSNLFPNTK